MGNDGRLELSALVAQLRCRWTDLGFVNLTKLADLTKLDPEFRQSCVRQATMVGSVLLRVSGCFAGLLLEISEQVGSRAPAC